MNTRYILLSSAFALTACAAPYTDSGTTNTTPPPPHNTKPNIVFILADDLGFGEVGYTGAGAGKILTPNIDRLASEGLRFSQAYAGAPVCAPSRCALMTGLTTGHTLIRGNAKVSLRQSDSTVAELLQHNGYSTMSAGKWGLGEAGSPGTPHQKGFDYFYGFIDQTQAHNSYPTFLYRNDDKITLRNVVPNPGPYGQGVATVRLDFANDLFDDEVLHFIDRTPADQPFFIYAAYTAPHANNEAHLCEVPDLGPYADKDWPEPEKLKAALITRLDSYVGHIMQKLHDRHLDQNTLVIFTSDNGPHEEGSNKAAFDDASGPLRGIKRDVYDGGFRVPFIARWPGHIAPNSATDQVIAFWDFLPTAAELAGTQPPKSTDGLSYLPTLLNHPAQQKQHDFLYWEFHERGFEQAVLMLDPSGHGIWKAVRHSQSQPLELYALNTDISEKTNVAAAHPDIIKKITDYLPTARTDSPDFPIRDTQRTP